LSTVKLFDAPASSPGSDKEVFKKKNKRRNAWTKGKMSGQVRSALLSRDGFVDQGDVDRSRAEMRGVLGGEKRRVTPLKGSLTKTEMSSRCKMRPRPLGQSRFDV